MSWVIASAPTGTTAVVDGAYMAAVAVRTDSETGDTEVLVADHQSSPRWVAAGSVSAMTISKPT